MRVAVLAERMRLDQAELAASLHSAYADGASLRALAGAAGISHEQVRRIVHELERAAEHRHTV
jgi:Helix-turn-helix domain